MQTVRQIVLQRRPSGVPVPADFALAEAPMPEPGPGEMLVKMRVGSVDPAIRGFLDDRPSYLPPVALGAPIAGMSLGEVVASNNADWPTGTLLRAFATWSDHYVIGGDALGLERVNQAPGVPLPHYMGALGPVGLTAWVGLFEVGQARPAAAAPEGIDVYFDNVGGEMLDAVLPLMKLHGRIPVCGMIAQYNDADHPHGIRNLWQLVVNRVRMEGFLTYDHMPVLPRAQAELDGWFADGSLRPLENLRSGFERLPEAFIELMEGRTIGKTMVEVA